MYSMPDEYKVGINDTSRNVVMYTAIGIGVDQTAADDISSVVGDFLPMSNPVQITDAIYVPTTEMATFEGSGIPTSSNNGVIAPPLEAVDNPPEIGVWSGGISDSDGNIDVSIRFNLSSEHRSAFRVYTYGPNVTSAEIIFGDGEDAETVACECFKGSFSIPVIRDYTSLTVRVTGIDRPYSHLRVVEVEFGSSMTFSSSAIAGEAINIRELDPTETTIPLDELDLAIVNVDGAYDDDNPETKLKDVAIGTPMTLSYSLEVGESEYTVPCGRYYIGEISSRDTRLAVVAFDPRWILSETYVSWGISSSENFGTTLDNLLTELNVPHFVEQDVYELYPDGDHTFDSEFSVLDHALLIQQAYGIYLVPGRDDSLHVSTSWPGGGTANIPADTIYSWPTANQRSRYNVVSVGYRSGVDIIFMEYDLRSDPKESRSILQIGDNPLITTEERARSLLNRLVSRLASNEVEARVMGDPAIDMGDIVDIPGRWSVDNPRSYMMTYAELVFDGGLTCTVKGQK